MPIQEVDAFDPIIIQYHDIASLCYNTNDEIKDMVASALELALCGFGSEDILTELDNFTYLFDDGSRFWENVFKEAKWETVQAVMGAVNSTSYRWSCESVKDATAHGFSDVAIDVIGPDTITVYYRY